MNRTIKFRAWDTRENKWTFAEMGQTSTSEEAAKNPFPTFSPVVFDSNGENVLMQFTGLLDKNGREIYEGDVAVAEDDFQDKIFGGLQNMRQIFFEDGAFWAGNRREDGSGSILIELKGYAKTCEVIGNIYENPELI